MSHSRPDDTYPLLGPTRRLGAARTRSATSSRRSSRPSATTATATTVRRARLKYLLEERGIDWLRDQIEARTGRHARAARRAARLGRRRAPRLARHRRQQGARAAGAVGQGRRRSAARTAAPDRRWHRCGSCGSHLARTCCCSVSPTPTAVENVLRANGVPLADDQSPTRNLAIACPALPTCSKALGEAERVLPDVVEQLEKVLADTGNTGLPLRLNMTGCPNGCSRPYAAELGIVGRTKKNYDIYVGGSPAGDRLARVLRADVPLTDDPRAPAPAARPPSPNSDDDGELRRLVRRAGLGVARVAPARAHRTPPCPRPPPDTPTPMTFAGDFCWPVPTELSRKRGRDAMTWRWSGPVRATRTC